ncbi:FliH/SctL family protein [Desulfocurvus sp. DL9XJH121]
MSLSKNDGTPRRAPRVIVGMGAHGPSESTVADLQGQRDTSRWTSSTEEEYMARVRERATKAAKEIISKAMADAAVLRENAEAEGFASAAEQAQAQVDQAFAAHAQTLGQAMAAMEEGAAALWREQRADVTALVRLAVEKILAVELDQRRQEILATVLDQSLEAIDSLRQLVVRVCPDDEELVSELLIRAKDQHPGLDRWRVRADSKLGPGGMILESAQGMADNSMEGRMKSVMAVLDQLDCVACSGEEETSG